MCKGSITRGSRDGGGGGRPQGLSEEWLSPRGPCDPWQTLLDVHHPAHARLVVAGERAEVWIVAGDRGDLEGDFDRFAGAGESGKSDDVSFLVGRDEIGGACLHRRGDEVDLLCSLFQ